MFQQHGETKLSVPSQYFLIRRQRPRHSHGQRPVLTQVGIRSTVAQEHVARRGGCRGFPSVDGKQLAVRQPDEDKTASTDSRVMAVHDTQRKCRGHGGVDGIATLLKSFDTR